MSAARHLTVLLAGQVVGSVSLAAGTLRFTYDDTWRSSPGAYPLSLSMPLTAATHPHGPVSAYLWGLLPDNQGVIDRWARRFQVSARSPFALLSHVGEECAGAVQFVLPDHLDALLSEAPRRTQWLDEAEIARRLRDLRKDPAASRSPTDTGQFSLAGAQPKTALLFEGGRWGVPSGRVPTTHILKPPGQDLAGHAENEHFCLSLARALGLPTATSEVRRFETRSRSSSSATTACGQASASSASTKRTSARPSPCPRPSSTRAKAALLPRGSRRSCARAPATRRGTSRPSSTRWRSTGWSAVPTATRRTTPCCSRRGRRYGSRPCMISRARFPILVTTRSSSWR